MIVAVVATLHMDIGQNTKMKTTQKLLVFFSALFCLIIANKVSAEKNIPFSRQQVELSYAPLVKTSSPAVVNIFTRKITARY